MNFLFPIQAKAVNHVHSRKDAIAQAQIGTGKTFSFAIPLTENLQGGLQDRKRDHAPQVQGPAFTRESANQRAKTSVTSKKVIYVLFFYGDTPYNSNKYRVG